MGHERPESITMINILIDRLSVVSRRPFYAFVAVSIAVAGIAWLLASKVSPWLYATNVHVRLHMQAPAETKISVCWDKSQSQCLPLVPYLSAEKRIAEDGEIADLWLSELPPRPAYTVSLIFKSKSNKAKGIFHDLELYSWPGILWGWLPGAGVQNTKLGADQFKAKDVTYTIQDGLYYFESGTGSHLTATREIKPGPSGPSDGMATRLIWSLLISMYLLFAIPLFMMPFAVENLGSARRDAPLAHYPWWAYTLCGVAILFMLLLTINSPVMFDASDQMVYVHVAIRRAWFFYTARPPGYYMFVALAFWLFGYNLNGVVLWQVVILILSATTCIWSLRRWLHPFVAVLVIFGILFSPAQVHWALSIMRESVFASLVLLGATAVIALFTTPDKVLISIPDKVLRIWLVVSLQSPLTGFRPRGVVLTQRTQIERIPRKNDAFRLFRGIRVKGFRLCKSHIWLAVFSIICGLALFVRENGILLPVLLLPVLLPEAVKRLRSPDAIWKRIQSVLSLFVRYAAPVLSVGIVYFGLSFYNYVNYGYFQFTLHVTSHHFFWQAIATSNIDPRGLLKPNPFMNGEAKTYLGDRLYHSFVRAQQETPGADPIYVSLFPAINQMTSEKGQPVNWFHSASIIDDIGSNVNTLASRKANIIGLVRQYREFIISNPSDTGGYPLLLDDPAGLAYKRQLLSQMEKHIAYEGRPTRPDGIINGYYNLASDYEWYRPLFLLAIICSLYILRYHDPVFLAPMTFFIANALLMIMLRTEQSRYIQSMDILLILQVALGLSRWIYRRASVVLEKFNLSLIPEK